MASHSPVSVDLDLSAAYTDMLRLRRFEERVLALRLAEEISGSVHLSGGQEATPVGTLAALDDDDRVIATYRGHGWALACGVPPTALFAEILGRASGTNGGRGGSAYLSSPQHRFLGENSIVGAGLPIANGVALAGVVQGTNRVAVAVFGEGATSQGATHEAMVMAVARQLPVLFICENNKWSEMTPISAMTPSVLSDRAEAYGMAAERLDGTDPEAIARAVARGAQRARSGEGPTFLECETVRLMAHYHADVEHYRDSGERADDAKRDGLPVLRARLLTEGILNETELVEIETEVDNQLAAAESDALAAQTPDASTARSHVTAHSDLRREPLAGDSSEMTFSAALNEALRRELATREDAVFFGEDVAIPGGIFGVSRRLHKEFGGIRVFDTPIAESAILGLAVGAAQEGLRPIAEIMYSDFLLVALDQLVNQAANVRYLHEGLRSAPLVVRCQQGATPGSCAQHSQSLEALLAHIPGLKVGLASTPHDAYAMLRAAVADPDPVITIESRALYNERGPVWLETPPETVGGARVRREGQHLAIVAWGRAVLHCIAAADQLAQDGVDATVIDLRWLSPLDTDALATAIETAGRVLVVHEANYTGGFGAEVAAQIQEIGFGRLQAPVLRLGAPDVRIPAAPVLQNALLPGPEQIVQEARRLLAR